MIRAWLEYKTFVFDCDGVVLHSNQIKTESFRSAARPWGENVANALVAHHVENGGISRYRKFAHFFETILPDHCPGAVPGVDGPGFDELLASYAQAVHDGLMTSTVAEGLETLREKTAHANWCIVSGGDQAELRDIFGVRGLEHLFDGGIFGSPDSKDIILARELEVGTIEKPALFLGDSRYDYEAAQRAGIDFVFVWGWTELADWQDFFVNKKVPWIQYLSDLLSHET
jgi:phosphoglycolate phosphatase-like HAD superfamily hydrolase